MLRDASLSLAIDYFHDKPGHLQRALIDLVAEWTVSVDTLPVLQSAASLNEVLMRWLAIVYGSATPNDVVQSLRTAGVLRNSVCTTVWKKGDTAYRCTVCEKDSASAVCLRCFENGNHADHEYKLVSIENGCCDCGDASAWEPSGFCKHHQGLPDRHLLHRLETCDIESAVFHSVSPLDPRTGTLRPSPSQWFNYPTPSSSNSSNSATDGVTDIVAAPPTGAFFSCLHVRRCCCIIDNVLVFFRFSPLLFFVFIFCLLINTFLHFMF